MALIFVLGFFLEWIEISYIAVPLFLPIFNAAGVDPVWLAMLITVNLQTSFLTPPFGWALFFLRGVAPPEITTRHIYVGIIPFVALQALGVVLVFLLPGDRHLAAQGDRLVRTPRRRSHGDQAAAAPVHARQRSTEGAHGRGRLEHARPRQGGAGLHRGHALAQPRGISGRPRAGARSSCSANGPGSSTTA